MSASLRELQEEFARIIFQQKGPFAKNITAQGVVSANDRIAIYQNAYRQRLRECLETDHEVLATYLGDEAFSRLADAYIENYPSRYPSLRNYGDRLSEFVSSTAPYFSHPVIADLARFERILLSAFDARDVEGEQGVELRNVKPKDWPELSFEFHPSVRIFKSDWNTVEIWQAIKAYRNPPSTERQPDSCWMVSRNHELVTVFRSLSLIESAVLERWIYGGSFSEGCEVALCHLDESEVSSKVLKILIANVEAGIISHVRSSH